MQKLLIINSCINRSTSRTEWLKNALVEKLTADEELIIEEVILENEQLVPLDSQRLNRRIELAADSFDDPVFKYAVQLAAADMVVVAAPFWDLSFPAMLKTYLEYTTVTNLTFRYNELGIPVGMCRASKLYYVTTGGGPLGKNLGYEYVKALFDMYGITDSACFAAENLDVLGCDITSVLKKAIDNMKI